MKKQPTVLRAAHWSALHPGRAIAGWFVFVALCLAAGLALGNQRAGDDDFQVGESGRAFALAIEAKVQDRPAEHVMIHTESGPLDREAADAAARDVTARMEKLPEVTGVADPVLSDNGRMLRVEVSMKGTKREAKDYVEPLLEQTAEVQEAHPGLVVEQNGDASVTYGLEKQRGKDLTKSELITLPVTLVTLLVVFGSLVMISVPLLLAVTSILGAVGLSMVVSHVVPDSGLGMNMILLIGMAVGVDYTLFYLKREREERELAGGRLSPEALVGIAAATSGRAVVVSALAVIVSTATLFLADDVIFSTLATGTIIVVFVAMISSVTVLPALLVTIGRRMDRKARRATERGKKLRRRTPEKNGRVWAALLKPAQRRPAATLILSVLVMLGLAAPALGMDLRVLNKDTHSRQIPEMRAYDRLNDAFPHLRAEHWVVVRADAGQERQVAAALDALADKAGRDPAFAKTPRELRISADGRTSLLTLRVPYKLSSPQAKASLDHLRDDYLPATLGTVEGAEYGVDGPIAVDRDYLDNQNEKLPLILAVLLLVTFVMTVLVFGSVVLGLIGVLLNLLSVAAAFGVLVVFFQWGLASTLFGFEHGATSEIGSRVPLFLFVILFGLSMDYQVFVVSRIREAALTGMPTREAVMDGLAKSAKVVTSAAVVMVTVFSTFVFLHLAEMKQIGFSLAVAVLLDAFVIRILILPSAMVLLGRASWWPSTKLRRAAAERKATTQAPTATGTPAATANPATPAATANPAAPAATSLAADTAPHPTGHPETPAATARTR
ncbi:MMPL family transporter [Streptomyces longispororuber]|uniref:MMPL family transporter n=1 Tax=Streptomyces longispororuber TaxID=68230 RepID=UPI0036FEF2DC